DVTIDKLRSGVTDTKNHRERCASGGENHNLEHPRLQVIQDDIRNHFFLRLSFSSWLISSSSSGVIFFSSTRCTSNGFADPLKTRLTKSWTMLPRTSCCALAGV